MNEDITMNESLFSFELHVESVDRVKVPCVIPAVCFRLLDYPTLIIHLIPTSYARKLVEKIQTQDITKEHVQAELRDRYGNIPFQKGKSCLFKAAVCNLHQQLETTPLYVMLIDLCHRNPRLVGSTSISLSKAVNKITANIKRIGVSVPSACEEEGMFDIFNLMGSIIGRIKLSFRFLSLGGSLLPHIPTKSIMTGKQKKKTDERDIRTNKNETVIFEVEDVDVEQNNDVYSNKAHSGLDSEPRNQHTETQTEQLTPRVHTTLKVRELNPTDHIDDVLPITNTLCPPPLYYNFMSHAENLVNKKSEHEKPTITHKGTVGVDDIDYIYYKPELLQPDGSVGCASVCIQTENEQTNRPDMSKQDRKDTNVSAIKKRQDSESLPLLNALLDELTYLQTKRENSQVQDSYTGKPKKEKRKTKMDKPSESRECCLQVALQKSSLPKSMKKDRQVVPKKKVKFKQSSLTYGMTKTQLMRLEMNQKDKMKNSKLCDTDSNKTLPLHTYSRQKQDILKNVVPGDFGKTHKTFTTLGEEETVTMSVGVQTDQAVIPGYQNSSDTKNNEPEPQDLGKTVTVSKLEEGGLQADVDTDNTRSLARQNSLDIYLPQVEGDSDSSKEVSLDDVPLPELPTTTTTYGHTGIHSPDIPEPMRRTSTTSPPVRSRTSTALSMYSDDFEESQIWEAQSLSENDESNTSSFSHSSTNSHTMHPILSNFSPEKSKKMTEMKRNNDNGSAERSLQKDSRYYKDSPGETPDISKEILFDSLNSAKSDM